MTPAERAIIHAPCSQETGSSDSLVAAAVALTAAFRDQAAEADARGCYSPEMHEKLKSAGLYRVLQPKMFGGHELDVLTYLRIVMAIAEGHPAAAWCYALASAHCVLIASHLPESVQREIFGPAGDFRAPHRAPPSGTWRRVDGGFVVSGKWSYASGSPVSTHFIGGGSYEVDGEQPRRFNFVVPREQFRVLPDWGAGATLGLEASGSNTVELENVFVPDRFLFREDIVLTSEGFGPEDGQGARIHHNPLYVGVVGGFFPSVFAAIFVGAAKAALREYEATARTNPQATTLAAFGKASTLVDCAEALTRSTAEQYMATCDVAYRCELPITVAQSVRLWAMGREASSMACDAIELLFRTSPVTAANRGSAMHRYIRDVQMYRIHPAAQPWLEEARARASWSLPLGRFGH